MAKNRKRKTETKKDQNISNENKSLFEESITYRDANDQDPKLEDIQDKGVEGSLEKGFVISDVKDKVDEVNRADTNFVKQGDQNSVLDRSADPDGKVYQSGEVISWNFSSESLDESIGAESEKKSVLEDNKKKIDDLVKVMENVSNETRNVLNIQKFDVNKPSYIEIHSGNIFHYFSSGLVTPSKYVARRAFPDLQTINNNYLVLVNTYSHSATEDHILLELDLRGVSKDTLVFCDNFALLEIPIAVSKIKRIIVQHSFVKDSIIKDALIFNGGFIPEHLIMVDKSRDKQQFDVLNAKTTNVVNYEGRIDKFDRVLGLLAFLRNYDILISSKTKSYKTLPNHFFYAMQVLDESFGNNIIGRSTISEFYSYLFNDSCPSEKELLKWIFTRVNIDENFTDKDTLEFGKLMEKVNDDPVSIRKKFIGFLSQNLERKKALKLIDEVKSKSQLQLYLFAFLRNYANLNNIEISRKDLESVYSVGFGEYAFAVLGYFYGYKNLNNTDERINLPDVIADLENTTKPAIKFQLTTRFDYQILEYVYYFAFGSDSKIGKSFIRIPDNIFEEKPVIKHEIPNYRVFETMLYGKRYLNLVFNDPFSLILEEVSGLPEEIPLISDFGIFCYNARLNIKPIYIMDIHHAGSVYDRACFSRNDLYNYLKENRNSIDVKEVQMRLQLSKKYSR
ncbi:hypothetical protein [Sphingobacterium siyangense]|uniref:hypothetical protein n=1 Tax=Sphingobacterium siyangense TaxID=459529 RepID=UPI002FDD3429